MTRPALRLLLGVRGRVALLLLFAAIPLMMLAVVIVWQNYRMVADKALERVEIARAATEARYQTMLDGAGRALDGLAADPAIADASAAACGAALARAHALLSSRFLAIGVYAADGTPHCRSGALPDPDSWFAALRAHELTTRLGGEGQILVALPRAGAAGGAVAASLALATLVDAGSGVQTWLVDVAGNAVPLGGGRAPLPVAAVRAADPGIGTLLTVAADGRPYAFASVVLPGGARLLVTRDIGAEIDAARGVLWRRLAGLVLLLGAGLAAVALGANVALVRPIKRLSAAVQSWQPGVAFDPGPPAGMPLEVQQLARSFAQAFAALAEREHQLGLAVEQQNLLMQEIHHRVKNNLQIIASLLNLQASRIRLPEARREFASARDRIRALATLHRHLYVHGDLHTINMRSFLHELCDQLLAALGETAGGRIHLEIEAPALQISSDQAVPMALIVTEAVSNAAKYAFPDGRHGRIHVTLSTAGEEARLVIQDDGVGIPAGPAETDTGMRDGIGIHLIRGFARQLGGRLDVTQHDGTCYDLHLRLRRDRAEALAQEPPLSNSAGYAKASS